PRRDRVTLDERGDGGSERRRLPRRRPGVDRRDDLLGHAVCLLLVVVLRRTHEHLGLDVERLVLVVPGPALGGSLERAQGLWRAEARRRRLSRARPRRSLVLTHAVRAPRYPRALPHRRNAHASEAMQPHAACTASQLTTGARLASVPGPT